MSKKAAALFTLAAFVIFSTSCTMWRTREINTTADYPKENRKILSVVKASGELVVFSKSNPGRLIGNVISGEATVVVMKRSEIVGPFPSIKKDGHGRIFEVTDSSGRVHSVQEVLKEETNKLTVQARYSTSGGVSIPLSEVKLVQFKATNGVMTALAVLGGIAGVFLGLAAYYINRD
jgi:hypothetical protein